MIRKQVVFGENVTLGEAHTKPQTFSDWHHHANHTTCVYVLRGVLRIDWESDGRQSVELRAGDFYVIQPNTIHREGNPGTEDMVLIAFYYGQGPTVVNVESPVGFEAEERKQVHV
jgi:quercetin dioxygenase-like cupin family protein